MTGFAGCAAASRFPNALPGILVTRVFSAVCQSARRHHCRRRACLLSWFTPYELPVAASLPVCFSLNMAREACLLPFACAGPPLNIDRGGPCSDPLLTPRGLPTSADTTRSRCSRVPSPDLCRLRGDAAVTTRLDSRLRQVALRTARDSVASQPARRTGRFLAPHSRAKPDHAPATPRPESGPL